LLFPSPLGSGGLTRFIHLYIYIYIYTFLYMYIIYVYVYIYIGICSLIVAVPFSLRFRRQLLAHRGSDDENSFIYTLYLHAYVYPCIYMYMFTNRCRYSFSTAGSGGSSSRIVDRMREETRSALAGMGFTRGTYVCCSCCVFVCVTCFSSYTHIYILMYLFNVY